MAWKCVLCRRNIKKGQPGVKHIVGQFNILVHEACRDYDVNPKEARKIWNFTKYKRKEDLK